MIRHRDVEQAATHIRPIIHKTPLDYSKTFSDLAGNSVYLKLENLQKTGSFKIRGAFHKIDSIPADQRNLGVIAASAGNHAQGVAYAASMAGIKSTIVMPEGAPLAKIEATTKYGANVVLDGASYDEAYAKAVELQKQTGAVFIHAFDDPQIIAGQGTIGLEILEQLPSTDIIVVPVGGGGLISGIAIAVKALKPGIAVIGVEAAGCASMIQSLSNQQPTMLFEAATIADGIAVKRPGELTYQLVKQYVDDIVTVDDVEIARTMLYLLERNKLVVEGSGAAALAALLYHRIPARSKTVAAVISGGNVDVNFLSRIIEHGLAEAGRYLRIVTSVPDKPGFLQKLLRLLADQKANIISVQHYRLGPRILLGQVEVELDLETRDQSHIDQIMERLQSAGYTVMTR